MIAALAILETPTSINVSHPPKVRISKFDKDGNGLVDQRDVTSRDRPEDTRQFLWRLRQNEVPLGEYLVSVLDSSCSLIFTSYRTLTSLTSTSTQGMVLPYISPWDSWRWGQSSLLHLAPMLSPANQALLVGIYIVEKDSGPRTLGSIPSWYISLWQSWSLSRRGLYLQKRTQPLSQIFLDYFSSFF